MAGERVLIVEDEAIVAMEIEARLKKLGYVVAARFGAAEDALDAFDHLKPDIVLMDIMLAGRMDGIEAATEIKKRFHIPVIYLTAYADDRTLERAKLAEAYGYLLKPFDSSDLRVALAIALSKHAFDQKLAEHEAKLRMVVENSKDIIYRISLEKDPQAGKIDFVGGGTGPITGCRSEDFIQNEHLWFNLIHPDDRQRLFDATKTILSIGRPGFREYRIRNRDTEMYKWIEDKVVPQFDEAGSLIGYFGIARDVSERRQAEVRLHEAKFFLQTVTDAISAHLAVLDDTGVIVMTNEAWKRFGRENGLPAEQGGTGVNYITVCETAAGPWSNGARVVADGIRDLLSGRRQEFTLVYPCYTPDVTYWFHGHFSRFTLNGTVRILVLHTDISDLKHAQKELKQSEERFRAAFEEAGIATSLVDLKGCFLQTNAALERMLGYDRQELIGKYLAEITHPNDRPLSQDLYRLMMEGHRRSFQIEERYLRKDGHVVWGRVTVTLVRNGNGEPLYSICMIEDITERKLADETLRQSYDTQHAISELLRISLTDLSLPEVLERALDIIIGITWLSFESKGCIFLADGNAMIMTAHRNMDDQSLRLCSRIEQGICLCGQAAAQKELIFADRIDDRHSIVHPGEEDHGHYCIPIMHTDKLIGVLNIYIRTGHQRSEIEVHFLLAVADALAGIIQRKRIEEDRVRLIHRLQQTFDSVERSKKEWENTFDSINDPIYITDSDYTIVRANKAFSANLVMDLKDVIGKKCHVLIHGMSSPPTECPHTACLQKRAPCHGELSDPRTHEVYQISAFPLSLVRNEKASSIVVMKNITGERDKEIKLIMNERLASLGTMAAGVAHEINNPLAAIAGSAAGLLNRVNQDRYDHTLFANYLGIIQEEIARCKKITTGMLSFVRPSPSEQRVVNIHDVLDKTLELIGFQGRLKNVEVLKDYVSEEPLVSGGEGELKQIFLVVMTNALDSMEERGRLTIKTGRNSRQLQVVINDTGAGIETGQQHRIFDPFYTTKSGKGGTGLGLSIAKKIVNNYGGDIAVTSEPGKGATFIITLPSQS